jgi:peptidoglycan/LPS O-acetylase OafA/YrhL
VPACAITLALPAAARHNADDEGGWLMTIESEGPRARRFAWLDLLRLVCATSVLFFHYGFVAPVPDRTLPLGYAIWSAGTLYGQFGVHVFFIISGFVISLSAEGRTSLDFLWARFVRLYPAYWVAVFATTAVLMLLRPELVLRPLQVLANLTMLQSFIGLPNVDNVYHTLAIELRFYAVIAVLLALRVQATSLQVIAGWLALCVASLVLPPLLGKLFLASWAPYFLAGMLTQSLLRPDRRRLKLVLLAVAILLEWRIVGQDADHRNSGYVSGIGCVIVLAGNLIAILCAFVPNPRNTSVLAMLGALTYPLYLIHDEIGVALMRGLQPWLPAWIVISLVIVAMFGLAYLMAQWIEPAIRRWLKALRRRDGRSVDRAPIVDALPKG